MTLQPPGGKWIYDVNVGDFNSRVLSASQQHPVLVDFWAEWCAPCLVIAPVLARVIEEHDGALELAKVEVDAGENMKLAGRYRVRGFPTVMLFRQGEELGRFSGAQPVSRVRDFVKQYGGL
jgi:putative thioredoxin